MTFLRLVQQASGIDVIIPRPKDIQRPLETKSKTHHLRSGAPSSGNNTNMFVKYKLEYKDGLHESFLANFITLQLAEDRVFEYYADSLKEESEEVYLIGKLSFTFLNAQIKHCHNLKLEMYSNG